MDLKEHVVNGHCEIPEGVKEIRVGAFYRCRSLKRIKIPGSVTKIGGMAFVGCRSLEKVKIGEGVKEIEVGAFNGCEKLESINIPVSVEVIGDDAFADCNMYKDCYLPGKFCTPAERKRIGINDMVWILASDGTPQSDNLDFESITKELVKQRIIPETKGTANDIVPRVQSGWEF